eukprot:2490442-Amphidinium_carterae.1
MVHWDPELEALPPDRDIPQPVDKSNITFQPIPDYDVDASSLVSEEPHDEAVIHTAFLRPRQTDGVRSKAAGAPPPRPVPQAAGAACLQPAALDTPMSQAARVVLGPPVAASTPGNAGAASQRPELVGHPVQQAA